MSAARLNARLRALEEPSSTPRGPRVLLVIPDVEYEPEDDFYPHEHTCGRIGATAEIHLFDVTTGACKFLSCTELHGEAVRP